MRVVPVEGDYEQVFHDYVKQDPLDFFFFILDWTQRRDQTKILLAIEEADAVQGAVLLYADYIAQLRGSREAVKSLLEEVNLEKAELQAPRDCEDIILKKYKPDFKHELVLMRLGRGEEKIQITTAPVRLGREDACEVAKIMKEADPEWWGDRDTETQRRLLETTLWVGIKQDGKIVSVGGTRLTDFASNINTVATGEDYRNRGYATSIVSVLVQEILKHSPIALIHVLHDNVSAIRAYSKVGFKPYKRYLVARAEKIKK